MFIEKICRASVFIEQDGSLTLLFTCLGADHKVECDPDGTPHVYAVPLRDDDAELAGQVRRMARWLSDMTLPDIQAEIAAINQATLTSALPPPGQEPQPEGGRKRRRRARGRQTPPEPPPTSPD